MPRKIRRPPSRTTHPRGNPSGTRAERIRDAQQDAGLTGRDDGKPVRFDNWPDWINDRVRRDSDAIRKVVDPFLHDARITLVVGLVMAAANAVLDVVARRYKAPLADRLRGWVAGLLSEYRLRCADPEEGGESAAAWLLRTLEEGKPPRRSQSEDEDARIAQVEEELRFQLAPVFARFPRATKERDSQVRPIAEKVLGRQLTSPLIDRRRDRLDSSIDSLKDFVPALLECQAEYSIVRRSKAKRRWRRRHAEALASYAERRLRIALRAEDAALAAAGLTRAGVQERLNKLRQYITELGTPRRPGRKAR